MGHSTYNNWTDTGKAWPQTIPQHWELKKFRFLFKFGRGLGITKSDLLDEGIPCVNYGEIHSKFGFEVAPEQHDLKCVDETNLETGAASLLNDGDFVFADTSEDIEGSGNFTYLNSKTPTFAGYHTVIARPTTGNSSRFIAYLFDSEIFRFQIRKNVSGVKVYSITQDILKNCQVWLPPQEEQDSIVSFLDRKTRQIDQLIESKKALIEKLDEQRIAVVTRFVTKGINEKVKLRPSGVDWLGDIPEHWEVRSLKFCCEFLNNRRVPLSAVERTGMPRNYPYYGASGIIDYVEDYIYEEPTILVAEDGANLLSRSTDLAFVASGKYWVNNHAHILKPFKGGFDYWANLLCIVRFDPWITGSAQPKLSKDNLGSIPLPCPPELEQKEIGDSVSAQIARIGAMKEKIQAAINSLKEYRVALITNTVSGKIDVRNIKIPQGE